MSGHAMRYMAAASAVSLLVLILGQMISNPAGDAAIVVGVAVALASQLLGFWLLGRVLFPGSRMAAQFVGMLLRMTVIVLTAFAIAPATGLSAVPMLVAVALVLFASSLAEPLLFVFYPGRTR